MNWNTAARKFGLWLRPSNDAKSSTADFADASATLDQPAVPDPSSEGEAVVVIVRKLRRRLLSRKGARVLVQMVERQDAGMLAILDANGVVVYWHDGMAAKDAHAKEVLGRHVAQFYAPKKHSQMLARDHLCKAFSRGGSSEFGWRRCPDGTVFWGMTVIEPLLLRDGRLQGFTHVTRAVNEPCKHVVRVQHQTTGIWGDGPSWAGTLSRRRDASCVSSQWHTPGRQFTRPLPAAHA